MKVYGYVRVWTDRQADDGESLGTQRRTIEGYAMMQSMTLSEIFVERGVSGASSTWQALPRLRRHAGVSSRVG